MSKQLYILHEIEIKNTKHMIMRESELLGLIER